jgi:hypothetical protein
MLETAHNVKRRNIAYDATGSGMYLKNYFPGAYVFHSGARAIKEKTDFEHLKTQCYYKYSELINEGKTRIFDKENEEDICDELMQIKTIPRDKLEGKIKMIRKIDIKAAIGRSPDYLDALSMRMVYEYKTTFKRQF